MNQAVVALTKLVVDLAHRDFIRNLPGTNGGRQDILRPPQSQTTDLTAHRPDTIKPDSLLISHRPAIQIVDDDIDIEARLRQYHGVNDDHGFPKILGCSHPGRQGTAQDHLGSAVEFRRHVI